MKEKIYFHNITRTLVSFCVFILAGKLAGFVVGGFSTFQGTIAEMLQFVFAAAVAVLVFLTFETFLPSPEQKAPKPSVMDGRFRRRPFSLRRYVLESIPHTIASVALLVASMYLVTVAFNLGSGALIHEKYPNHGWAEVLSLLLLHPVAEEYLFRGLYYGELRSMNPIFACLMQAVTFAIAHNGVGGMMYALIAGIILGTAAERSNGIAVPIAAHVLINLRTFLVSGILPEDAAFLIDGIVISAGILSAGVLVLLSRLRAKNSDSTSEKSTEFSREEADFED